VSAPARTWAVVPAKRLEGALRRLAPALEGPLRRELQVAMLRDVFGACAGASALAGLLVVTSDPFVAALGRERAGAEVIDDHDPPRGMNGAVARGLAAAAGLGADAALVMTADLPLALAEDVEAIVAAAPPAPSAVLVPSHEGTGTNAMLLRPPAAIAPRLGPRSLARHLAQAERRGVRVRRLERPRLALDIDTPRDLVALIARGDDCATVAACMRLSVADRLAAGSAL
jgi:2-phospho-L-lactate/phosphoenolpyruvate guanylyltransferase